MDRSTIEIPTTALCYAFPGVLLFLITMRREDLLQVAGMIEGEKTS
jgi:hydrogenase-4 membrane subunit HyfE